MADASAASAVSWPLRATDRATPMLRHRILTAIVLLALLVPAMVLRDPWLFEMLTLLMIGAAGWEWARLNGLPRGLAPLAFGAVLVLMCMSGGGSVLAFDAYGVRHNIKWILPLWLVGGTLALGMGPNGWQRLPAVLRLALGLVLLCAGWLALFIGRMEGLNFLLSAMCIVWVADIAAYFGGRAFGRRKLAPTISPGKTWEGAISGALGVMLLAAGWMAVEHFAFDVAGSSVFARLQGRWGLGGMLLALLLLTYLSVLGDLFESLVKRAAGAKDSSQLLPGHGGVLDRVDALLPVLPAALALVRL